MSNTPETDACQKLKDMIGDEYVSSDFARKLKRKRDEALNAFIMVVDEMVQVQSQLREAKREFDRLADVIKASTILITSKGRHNTMLAYEGLKLAFESLTTTEP